MGAGPSRGAGFVTDLSLEGSRVLANAKRSGPAARRGAQVSGQGKAVHVSWDLLALPHLLHVCEQNLMKFVGRTTSPMLCGRSLPLGKQQLSAALPMLWVSCTSIQASQALTSTRLYR